MKKIYLLLFLIIIAVAIFFLLKNPLPKGNSITNTNNFQPPLDRATERITKKPFGIFITLQNSPVQPERFQGYHTGVDFEIFPEELNVEVSIRAACSGELKLKEYATGYGGVAVQGCELNKEPITVIYGHLKLSSITASIGEKISTGDVIGILGANQSSETNGERKHLHLGFHKGTAINISGYVSSQSELSNWIDPCLYVCHN
jgi:murein DD-endopeptidase MepM/ murein hydrolase activator NlpD